MAQAEYSNSRLIKSLENRAKAVDDLLLETRNDILRIWIPLACGAAMLIGRFLGREYRVAGILSRSGGDTYADCSAGCSKSLTKRHTGQQPEAAAPQYGEGEKGAQHERWGLFVSLTITGYVER